MSESIITTEQVNRGLNDAQLADVRNLESLLDKELTGIARFQEKDAWEPHVWEAFLKKAFKPINSDGNLNEYLPQLLHEELIDISRWDTNSGGKKRIYYYPGIPNVTVTEIIKADGKLNGRTIFKRSPQGHQLYLQELQQTD